MRQTDKQKELRKTREWVKFVERRKQRTQNREGMKEGRKGERWEKGDKTEEKDARQERWQEKVGLAKDEGVKLREKEAGKETGKTVKQGIQEGGYGPPPDFTLSLTERARRGNGEERGPDGKKESE